MRKASLKTIREHARACTLCAPYLPNPPRPIFRVAPSARIAVIGQAPGSKVHESGVPWQDDSGAHLLEWLDVNRHTFDSAAFAILPMGFCFPGRRAGGDLPPRPECAPTWHPPMLESMPHIRLRLLIGQYAQAYYLEAQAKASLTETVKAFADYLPTTIALPHPSWRSRIWMKKNPWFEQKVLPMLRRKVKAALR